MTLRARLDRIWMTLRQWWGERHGGYLSPLEDQMEHWPEPSRPPPPDIEAWDLPSSEDAHAAMSWDTSLHGTKPEENGNG